MMAPNTRIMMQHIRDVGEGWLRCACNRLRITRSAARHEGTGLNRI